MNVCNSEFGSADWLRDATMPVHGSAAPNRPDRNVSSGPDSGGTIIIDLAIEPDSTRRGGLWRHVGSIFRAGAPGLVIQDSEGCVVEVNSEAERLLGLSEDQMIGRSSTELFLKAIDGDGKAISGGGHPAMIALRTGAPQLGSTIGILSPTGLRRWLVLNATRDIDSTTGKPFTITSFTELSPDHDRDALISVAPYRVERVRSELAAYQDALDQNTIVAVTDRAGRITKVNAAFCRISGYTQDELLGKTHSIVNSGRHPSVFFSQMWSTIASGESWHGEICNKTKNGSEYWVDTTIVSIKDRSGRIEKYISIRYDITQRKQYERSLIESERRLSAAIDGTGVGIWDWNIETGNSTFNQRWANIIGYSLDELNSISIERWNDFIHPSDLRCANDAMHKHLTGETDAYDAEFRVRHRDGHWVWIHDRGRVATWTRDGRPLTMAGTYQDITSRKEFDAVLIRTNSQLKAVIDNFPGGVNFVDSNLKVLGCNSRFKEMLELPEELFEGGLPSLVDVFRFNAIRGEYGPGDVDELVRERCARALQPAPHVFERTRPNGVTLEVRGMPIPDGGFVTTYLDISDRIAAQKRMLEKTRQLEQASRDLQVTLAHMNQAISVFDSDGRLVLWNFQFHELFTLQVDDLSVGLSLVEILRTQKERDQFDGDPEGHVEAIAAAISAGSEYRTVTYLKSGRVISTINAPTPDGGWVATHEDVTERERTAQRITFAAQHDNLTGLVNRAGLGIVLQDAFGELQMQGLSFSVILIDLDRFKAVNDNFGHSVGDRLLQIVAERMLSVVRQDDVVVRLGGDEFAIVVSPTQDQRETSILIAARLLNALSAPYTIEDREVYIGASIGVAVAPDHGKLADTLMQNADSALYEVKSSGRNAFKIFDDKLAMAARDRRALENDLREALGRGELSLVYQPIFSVPQRRIVEMEALVRWNHPARGLVSPDVFIPIAEQTGMIGPIGQWVMETAFAAATNWPKDVRLAINVSPTQLGKYNFVDLVARELLRSRLDPARLEIEVTETVLLGNDDLILTDLHQLRGLNIRIALDDFGTGYSSLSYLKLFPFDKIKIDRSFVRDIEINPHCLAIVGAVAGLARSLNIDTTVEGVETESQYMLIAAAGCSTVQGFLFGRPLPVDEIAFEGMSQSNSERRTA